MIRRKTFSGYEALALDLAGVGYRSVHATLAGERPPHSTQPDRAGDIPKVYVTERRADWFGSGAVLALLAAAYLIVTLQDQVAQLTADKAAAEQRAADAMTKLARIESAPHIRLDPDVEGRWHCRNFHVKAIWLKAIGERCDDLGQLLLQARTKD